MKIKNSDIQELMKTEQGKGIDKLMNHPNLDSDKAYDLSLMIPELTKQFGVIEENRKRISGNIFPLSEDKKTQKGFLTVDKESGKYMTSDNKVATADEIATFKEGLEKFNEEFGKVLEKEVEIAGDKIELSRVKDETSKRSELQNLNLTVVDLMSLAPLINVTK